MYRKRSEAGPDVVVAYVTSEVCDHVLEWHEWTYDPN